MAFDAGSVIAKVGLDQEKLDRDIDDAERKLAKLERDRKAKISAVFDNASMTKARKLFADLDNQLSRDAMQRLRSSPQGSILGALNSLFSPHQVSGGPTAQQAGSQGLLGRMIGAPGGGGGQGPTTGSVIQKVVQQASGATAPGTVTQDVREKQIGTEPTAGTTTEKVKLEPDTADIANKLDQAGAVGGDRAGKSFMERFKARITGLGGGGGGGAGGSGGFLGKLLGGIGPGILGVSAKAGLITAGGGALLGSLGPLLAGVGALGLGGAGVGVLGLSLKELIGKQNQQGQAPTQGPLYAQGQAAGSALKSGLMSAMKSLVGPLGAALGQVPKLMQQIMGPLKNLFASAGTLISPLLKSITTLVKDVLPGLGAGFRAAAPLLQPLVSGIGQLVKQLLPGIITLLKVAGPGIQAFAQILGTLGKDVGGLFAAFAPVIKQSSVLFKALFDLIGGLVPIIGKLGAIFASSLAPVFVQFAGVVKSLLPFLEIVGKILGSLASAVLGDLVGAFGALAQLLQAIAPSLSTFAKAISGVFTVLENTGVFAILGNALEALVGPLASIINALLKGLTPVLPVLINLIGQLSSILANLIAAGLGVLLNVVAKILNVLSPLLPVIIGVIGAIKLWTIAQGLLDVALTANPIGLIVLAIVALIGAITLLVTHWKTVWGDIKKWAEDAWKFIYDGFGKYLLPLLGPVGLIALGAIELAKHWSSIWDGIKNTVVTVWHFLYNNIFQPMDTFFTKTLPGWVKAGVDLIESIWDGLVKIIEAPLNIIKGIVNFVTGSGGSPAAVATGGKIHGHASGGVLNEPIFGVGVSGRYYSFAEQGPETVVPGVVGGAGNTQLAQISALLSRLISTTAAVPGGVDGQIGTALGIAGRQASFRVRYPRNN